MTTRAQQSAPFTDFTKQEQGLSSLDSLPACMYCFSVELGSSSYCVGGIRLQGKERKT